MLDERAFAITDPLIPMDKVKAAIGVSRTTIYELIKSAGFPAPVKLGPNMSRWSAVEVQDWIDARKRERAAA